MIIISSSFVTKVFGTFVLASIASIASIGAAGCSSSTESGNAEEAEAGTSTEALSTGQYVVTGGSSQLQGSYAWDNTRGWIWLGACSRLYYSPSSSDWGYRCVTGGCHWYARAWDYGGSRLLQIRVDHISAANTVGQCG